MTTEAGKITADVFERVAAQCRWSTRSLGVARDLLVHGKNISEVAKSADMSVQQAGVLQRRFNAKVLLDEEMKVSARAFMQLQKPDGEAVLEPLKKELLLLHRKNYSPEQLLQFLSVNGIETSEPTLSSFLKKAIK